ncbi:DUF2169 domain-containing protein [Sorangium sp. KYC3313]|uniref:DUF2169 family type VI secretion system accessory protein n=1 Tax=Sorangium sp. KYC3313 TaxID=3449740 RepID=UPI003F88FE25
MDVVSACPLRVASSLWQPLAGAWALTIVCKATYTLAPGESLIAPEQDAPSSMDVYWEDDVHRSLVCGSDLAPFKRRADVLVVGHAYAPGRRPVTSLLARLAVGAIDKSIAVFGDRVFTPDGALSAPAPFVKMSLRWERAAGGAGTANPVGVPLGAAPHGRGMVPAPNLEMPGAHVTGHRDAIEPAGFGPIAPSWPGRAHKLGWHAATWSHAHWNERPLPNDIDAGYFNAAPLDQQIDEICPDERIVLENLHPTHARLFTSLRAAVPCAVVESGGAPAHERKLRCDTLCIDTDRGTCSLTWRGYVLLDHPQQAGRVVIALAEERRGLMAVATASELDVAGTLPAPLELQSREVLPFTGTTELPPLSPLALQPREALPFSGTTELPPPLALPSQLGAPRVPSSPFLPELAPHDAVRAEAVAPSTPPPVAEPPRFGPLVALWDPPLPEPQETQEPEEPAPPAQMATPDLREPTIEEVSVEACAALDASLALRPHEKGLILKARRLDEPAWARLRAAWAAEVKRELQRGRNELLRTYDATYVAQIEKERGPISADELARLTVGAERGNLAEALRDLGLPAESVIRVQRTWIARIARDAALGDEVRRAVARARAG